MQTILSSLENPIKDILSAFQGLKDLKARMTWLSPDHCKNLVNHNLFRFLFFLIFFEVWIKNQTLFTLSNCAIGKKFA